VLSEELKNEKFSGSNRMAELAKRYAEELKKINMMCWLSN